MTSNIEHIPNETLTKIMCFLELYVLQCSVSLVSKRCRHIWYQSAFDTFFDSVLAGVLEAGVQGARRCFLYANHHLNLFCVAKQVHPTL